MTRLVLLLTLLGACFESHINGMKELGNEDCYTCHTPDYEGTTAPVHRQNADVYTTACVSCHRTTDWKPALEGLHSEVFIIASGTHSDIKCLACHDLDRGASKAGANTNCTQCHPNDKKQQDDHSGVISVTGAPYQYLDGTPSFCLTCHPDGRAGKHPDAKFPRTGDHAVACESCHLRQAGPDTAGMNTTCVDSGCHHTLAWSDASGEHTKLASYPTVRGDGASQHFCLDSRCHPSGKSN